ncbi:MAG: DUF1517 domain-containing protein [Cyanobacteriota bacterium ELA615]|jgi:hypothetical protein
MTSWRDRLNRLAGKNRYVVCRIFVHLTGKEIAPLLGILNRAGRSAIESDGDLESVGESLVTICENLLQMDLYWQSAHNEGDVFWDEGQAGDYFNSLSTDSISRFKSGSELEGGVEDVQETPLTIPATNNIVVMISAAYIGEVPELETNLASRDALITALKVLINLHYQGNLEAIGVYFSPSKFGDELTSEQILPNFPELIPL